jgi:hypothetical protein
MMGDGNTIRTRVIEPTLAQDYKPVAWADNLFALAWIHYEGFCSTETPDAGRGLMSYNESTLIHLVEDKNNQVYAYLPSLYVDKSAPILSGRDMFGFPKSWGTVKMPPTVPSAQAITLETIGDEVPTFGTSMPSQSLTVYKVVVPLALALTALRLQNPVPEGVDQFMKLVEDRLPSFLPTDSQKVQGIGRMLTLLASFSAPLLVLKQLPSAQIPQGNAAYQAYVQVPSRVSAHSGITLFAGFEPTLNDWDSAPIKRSYLGSNNTATPLIGCHVEVDLELGKGIETTI